MEQVGLMSRVKCLCLTLRFEKEREKKIEGRKERLYDKMTSFLAQVPYFHSLQYTHLQLLLGQLLVFQAHQTFAPHN